MNVGLAGAMLLGLLPAAPAVATQPAGSTLETPASQTPHDAVDGIVGGFRDGFVHKGIAVDVSIAASPTRGARSPKETMSGSASGSPIRRPTTASRLVSRGMAGPLG